MHQRIPPGAARSGSAEAAVRIGLDALRCGEEALALPILMEAVLLNARTPRLWQVLGLLHRANDDLAAAVTAFERAAALAPGDHKIASGQARCALEAGYPAVTFYEHALEIAPDATQILPGLAAALLAERRCAEAIERVEDYLLLHPLWLEGHWLASRLRWLMGDRQRYTLSSERALANMPGSVPLWRQRAAILMLAENYESALGVVRAGRSAAGSDVGLDFDEAVCLSEMWQLDAADRIFVGLPHTAEVKMALHQMRHMLRMQRPDGAAELGLRLSPADQHETLLPYLSIAWRLLGDERWSWLEGDERLVGVYDLEDRLPQLDDLAALLRKMHVAMDQPPEQSLRGGTQTDGPLLSRADPRIRELRRALADAVSMHVAQLPPADPRHPTLSATRNSPTRFAGSWSVRLVGQGRHSMHVHPQGWLSSALYVSLPAPAQQGSPPAGWISLGEPQENLGLKLAPFRRIEPKAGRLVLFPSTMWHGTLPYPSGERLTVAFDVARPNREPPLPLPPPCAVR